MYLYNKKRDKYYVDAQYASYDKDSGKGRNCHRKHDKHGKKDRLVEFAYDTAFSIGTNPPILDMPIANTPTTVATVFLDDV